MASESIYDMIPQRQAPVRKAPRYKSQHNPTAPVYGSTLRTAKKETGSFGKPLGCSSANPSAFLKGRQGNLPQASPGRYQRGAKPEFVKKPSVPSRNERPVMGLQSTKNYCTANAVEAILAVPGNRARVSEQQPQYRNKVDYGKVPAYLSDVKNEIQKENEMIEAYLNQDAGQYDPYEEEDNVEIGEDELQDIIDALKEKWDSVNAKYQKMCHMVKLDTIGKVRRKETMESELTQLEKDIEKMSKLQKK